MIIEHLKRKKKTKRMERTNIISQLQATVMATCWSVCILNHKPLGDRKQRLSTSTEEGACTNTTQNKY